MKANNHRDTDSRNPCFLAIGHCSIDINFQLKSFIQENKKYRSDSKTIDAGGPAANAAALMASWLKTNSVYLGTIIGDDMFGNTAFEQLTKQGVCCEYICREKNYPTPVSCILSNSKSGSRTIINHRLTEDLYSFDEQSNRPWTAMLCDGHCANAAYNFIKKYPNVPSVLDAGSLHNGTEKLYPIVDYIVGSKTFAESLLSKLEGYKELTSEPSEKEKVIIKNKNDILIDWDSAKKIIDKLNPGRDKTIVITNGENGSWFFLPEKEIGYGHCAAISPDSIDTTAAGDIFHGAFTYCIGLGFDFYKTMLYSTIAAGLSTEIHGGMSSIPLLDDVEKYYQSIDKDNYITIYK